MTHHYRSYDPEDSQSKSIAAFYSFNLTSMMTSSPSKLGSRTSSKPLSAHSLSSSSLLPTLLSLPLSSSPQITSSSLETKGAHGELNLIKQSTEKNRFARFVNIHSVVNKLTNVTKLKELSSEEFNKSQIRFNLLKFEENEIGVHYKILYRNMFHLKVFKNLEAAQEFVDVVFPQMKFLTFHQLIEASKATGGHDRSVREILLIYLRQLAKDPDELPKLSIRQKPTQGMKLFVTSRKGSKGSLRLSLIPRQRQAVVPENQDIDPKELENISLRKSAASSAGASYSPAGGSQRHREGSISIRVSRALQRGDSGYSYREEGGAKCGSVTIITHKE
jgi:hypothetical protein